MEMGCDYESMALQDDIARFVSVLCGTCASIAKDVLTTSDDMTDVFDTARYCPDCRMKLADLNQSLINFEDCAYEEEMRIEAICQ